MLSDSHKLAGQIARAKELRDELRTLDNRINEKMQQAARRATPDDEAQMISAQARADSLFRDLGRVGAPPPIPSFETPGEYRRRLASELQPYSKLSTAKLDNIPDGPDAFDIAEELIYADAVEYAANPRVAPGEMIAIRKEGPNPTVMMTKYMGSPSAWMNEFAPPVRQFVRAWAKASNPFGVDIFS